MEMSHKKETSAQAIIHCLRQAQVEKVFCVPGESYLPVLDALYDTSSIQVISARHEGGAAFMAEAYAKSALKPGIVMATRGVGATNLSIGVHTAYQDSTPMVVFLGQVHSKFIGKEGFQEVDLAHYFQPIAKWSVELTDADRTVEIVQRAFHIAISGRPGPVIISLPEDVLHQETIIASPQTPLRQTPVPSATEVKKMEAMLNHAKRPVIIAGGGVKSAQAEVALKHVAELFHLPVLSAFRRHDVFPNDHLLYAGHLGLGTPKSVLKTVQQADVVLAFGTRLSEVTTQDYSLLSTDQQLIHIDIDFNSIGKSYFPDVAIVADMKEALLQLQTMKLTPNWERWASACNARYIHASRIDETESTHMNTEIISYLLTTLPDNAIITNDAGNFAGWIHQYYTFTQPHTYVGPTSGAMGYGLPAAIGAKLAFPNRVVVGFAGDGGFMMTCQELETAVRYNIPVICLVFNNKMYGTIRMHQEMHYPQKVIATDLGEVCFKDLAISVGALGYRVTTIQEFKVAFAESYQAKKPTVIEIMSDREQISVSQTITDIRDRNNHKK
ncbi:thiamine pyrophosphate protein [Virgibacillus pantothenticus]|uniref:Acetolactate synthase n=1 Tax=Virgibacillus pantothenticus TaxID=1473 RepID=A0A0L0QLG6_VIRPA|nr:thiamine pyrophosphate-dependent enzyme [Virgibacillus pantothenticus]KNE19093.1 acetolactate synthase [Virgibacillus pantothenticus]MED3736151.1 thiamine pyrophosphate-binding protein [Virgibacillus pantothenticus]QTY15545.1 acetolactate synthase [Virgibacillus pantothenticus]SIT00160.1 acetolactate synthase-1/2/3 large subunit [Virgibacillus pantothenticus]GIP64818.1 thiamine pyrophosphate protein [Virgibacillus pantothenticus]